MNKLSIRDLALTGKRLFVRVDFNVPLANGGKKITSDKRIQAALPTLRYALEQGAGLVVASHLGRPNGKPNAELSLAPICTRLADLLGMPVTMAPDCVGPEVDVLKPVPGEVLLLENLRFHLEEEANDSAFAKQLAGLCDLYVNDAFGTAHRAHASTVGMIQFMPRAAAGLLMEQELNYLTLVTQRPEHPAAAILGGAKVSDKIEVISNLIGIVDRLLIGGAMAYTFLKTQGKPVGKSLVEDDKLDLAADLLKRFADKIVLPIDHVVSHEFRAGAQSDTVDEIPDGTMGLDIGPKTISEFEKVIGNAKTIIWNGPMGVFEMPPFDRGTMAIAHAIANSTGVSVVGGGDSEKAVKTAGVGSKISHISTGGGASLEFLAGEALPGITALTEK